MEAAAARPPIADVLREAIRQGLLAPGQPLIQAAIAEAMGVSRIPVREALYTLAAEGVVTFGDDGGARVTELTPAEVDELWTLRALVEAEMAPGVVRNATDRDVASLRALVGAMDDLDPTTWSERNYALHLELYRLSGLRHFADAAARILNLIEPYSRVAVSVLREQTEAQAEHHRMVDAIAARDEDALSDLLRHHSHRARQALLEYASERDGVAERETAAEAARALARHLGG
ncbi:MAG: GntR family transcriptional regulator [Gaiellales bacterium]